MSRRPDIDMAKGLAILLVVFGHLVARADPAGVTWYEPARRAVYAFHMPFFLYLSGMVAMMSGSLLTPSEQWPRLVRARAIRLLVPFFGLGILVVAGKLAAEHVMFVDHPPPDFFSGFSSLVWHTAQSPALFIWYLYVLFIATIAGALLLAGRPRRLPWLLFGGAILYACHPPAYAYLDHIARYAIFFVLGAYAGALPHRWLRLVDRYWRQSLLLLLACCVTIARFGAQWPEGLILLPVGVISMPAIHGLVRHCPLKLQHVFLILGQYSFVIYLFNTMFIGLAKAALLHVYPWAAPHFFIFAVTLMAAGTLGPMALKHYALRHSAMLDRLTG